MSDVMEVLGTEVIIDGDIPATIRAVTIYSPHWVKYCCVWWDERTRREEWLTEDELKVKDGPRQAVSFR